MISILAVLAAAVTLVYGPAAEQWYFFLPAAALVVVAVIAWISLGRQKKSSRAESMSAEKPPVELSEGIISIRPIGPKAGSTAPNPDTEKEAPASIETPEPENQDDVAQSADKGSDSVTDPDAESGSDPLSHRYSDSSENGKTRFSSLPNPEDSRVLNGILEGFRSSIGAHAVGALRQLTNDGHEFSVLGTAGMDWAKTRGDRIRFQVPLLRKSQHMAIRSVNATDLPARYLSYSFNAGVIKRVAITRIGATSIVLLLDTVEDYGLMHPRTEDLIELFAQTLNVLFYREDPMRPRHEIISEEIARARARGQELALALVLLNNAESVSKLGQGLIQQVEDSMLTSLQRSSLSHRVEKFGELMFGVFTDGRRPSLEVWHNQVRAAFEEDDVNLDGGITIGIAVLSERHTDAKSLREDARNALVEAYNRGGRTVIA